MGDRAVIVPYVWEYQAVQERSGAMSLRVVPTARYTAAVGEALRRQLEILLGPETSVHVEPVETLELMPSGKRFVIRSAARDQGDGAPRGDLAP